MSRRILIVSNFFPPQTVGGAEIVAFRQARALAARGHEVVVLAGARSPTDTPPGALDFDVYEGLPVYRLAMRSLEPELNFYSPAAARRLQALISSRSIEVVHFHNLAGLGANLIAAAKATGAITVVTLHDHWGFCYRQTRLRPDGAVCGNAEECCDCQATVQAPGALALPMRLRRDYVTWCLSQADQLLTPSAYLAAAYAEAGFPSHRLSVLSNGIDLGAIRDAPKPSSPAAPIRFLYSGYLGEHKGVLVLLDALKRLAEDPGLSSRWQMTIAGDGHLQKPLLTALQAAKLTGSVRMLGHIPRLELLQLISASDVMVLPSIWPENQPVSLLEAAASGTAQIATRIGGNVELVEDLRTGLLVRPGDPADLAEAMRRYILEPSLAAQHGNHSREQRGRWDETGTIDNLEAILAGHPPRGLGTQDPVIMCHGKSVPAEAVLLLSRAHEHLPGPPTPRFIWHKWDEPAVWNHVALVWLWDRSANESLFQTALRRGIPILSPRTDWAQALARHYGGVIVYDTFVQALATLRVLLAQQALRMEIADRALASAAANSYFASQQAFALLSEALIEPS